MYCNSRVRAEQSGEMNWNRISHASRLLLTISGLGLLLLLSGLTNDNRALGGEAEIAVIVKTSNSSFWQHVADGARDAEKEMRQAGQAIKITFAGPDSETRLEEQVNLVENAVNRRVRAIVLAPGDPNALLEAARKAKAARIPLIIVDSGLNDPDLYVSFLSTNNRAAGELCAREMIKRLGADNPGEIAIMSYVAGVGSEIERVGGFTDVIKKESKLTIVGPFYSQSDMIKALDQTTDVLAAHPNLVGIFGANEPTAVGMGRAVAQARKAGRLVAIGFDGDKNLQNFIRDGTLQGIAVQNPYNMGYDGAKTALAAILRQPVEKNIDTGVVFVNKENVDSPEAQKVLY